MTALSQIFFIYIVYYTLSVFSQECADSVSKKCNTGKFCFWIMCHISSLYLICIIDTIKSLVVHSPHIYNCCDKIFSLNMKFFVWSFVMYLLYYSFLQFVDAPTETDQAEDPLIVAKYQFCGVLGDDLKPFDYIRCGLVTTFSYSQVYFSIYLIFLLGFLGIILFFIIKEYFKKRQRQRVFEDMEQVLEKVYMDPESLENFYAANKDFFEEEDLMDVEMRVYKDQFTVEFENCPKPDYKECIICFDSFDNSDKVVPFPGCKHNYHYECIEAWVKNHKNCPLCKGKFRDNFVKDLCEKMRTGFMRVSERNEC